MKLFNHTTFCWFSFSLLIFLSVCGCMGNDLEERFSRYKQAKEYSFKYCSLNKNGSGETLFEFSPDELFKLECEIDSIQIPDLSIQAYEELAHFPSCDGVFKFADGFEITIDCGVGQAGKNKDWLLDIKVPDEIGGVITSLVRVKNVLSDDRLVEFNDAMKTITKHESNGLPE